MELISQKYQKFFLCYYCKKKVLETTFGTSHRNHCPYCLWSQHLDIKPGDRKSLCQSLMKPIGLTIKKDGELMIVGECLSCGKISQLFLSGILLK